MPEVAPQVIICGTVFDYAEKAPFVVSGVSLLGAIEYNNEDDLLRCHECGDWFGSVAAHISNGVHGITVAEYKRRHGLRSKSALISFAQRDKASVVAKNVLVPARGAIEAVRSNGFKHGHHNNEVRKRDVSQLSNVAGSPMDFQERQNKQSGERRNARSLCQAQIIFRLQRMVATLNRTPSTHELIRDGIYPKMIMRAFGTKTLNQAIEMVGLQPNPVSHKLTREFLVSKLQKFKEIHGRVPSALECSGEMPSRHAFIREFGSMKNAFEESGIVPRLDERMPWPADYFHVSATSQSTLGEAR